MHKHTPGPWTYAADERDYGNGDELCGWDVTAANGECVIGEEGILGDGEANARLIAAAPELLEALIDCRRALEIANFTQELVVVDAAITKAAGEAS